MTTQRKSYSRQFKIDAVKLVTDQRYKISEAARNLEINPNLLGQWKNQLVAENDQAFPGKGCMLPEKECSDCKTAINAYRKWRYE
jgi:transposase